MASRAACEAEVLSQYEQSLKLIYEQDAHDPYLIPKITTQAKSNQHEIMVMAKIQFRELNNDFFASTVPKAKKQVFNGAATVDDTPMILLQVDMLQETSKKKPNLCGIQCTWKFSSSKVMQEDGSGLMSWVASWYTWNAPNQLLLFTGCTPLLSCLSRLDLVLPKPPCGLVMFRLSDSPIHCDV